VSITKQIITDDHSILQEELMRLIRPDYPSLIKQVRRQLELSQEDLARELGVSYATVNRWENGLSRPSKLARAQLDAFCERMQEAGMLTLPEAGRG
jgi:putative transcriptional regulator